MPNIKSAKKRVLVAEVNAARNKAYNSALKTSIKKANAAIENNDADKAETVKAAVKKFSGEFISRKISLDMTEIDGTVITDDKWLSFVIEQVISNALKYTPKGTISIYMEEPKILCIKDTGIGIAPEDLPRIFEKGYTGYNGRADKKASGIGLYLCKRICTNLGHQISAVSEPDQGTLIRISLKQERLKVE